jgi:predicted O-linked N-acetylglucosamine transferase (SPINDLY family)
MFEPLFLAEWNLIPLLKSASKDIINLDLLNRVLLSILEFKSQYTLEFAEACLSHFEHKAQMVPSILEISNKVAYQHRTVYYALALAKICLEIVPNNANVLRIISLYYLELLDFENAVQYARKSCHACNNLESELLSYGALLATLLRSGNWKEISSVAITYQELLENALHNANTKLNVDAARNILIDSSCFFYLRDNLAENRKLINRAAKLFENTIPKKNENDTNADYLHILKTRHRKLKLAFVGHTFRTHSVGWLSRWIFKYYNKSKFEIGIYFLGRNDFEQVLNDSFFQSWFANQVDYIRLLRNNPYEIASQIREDHVDILIDLDSLTLDLSCHVLALKPAPIQVSFLGFDAPGISKVDYFIADPYVLPDYSQEYYIEQIFRLPSTYIAVDGFELDVPSLSREQLGLPEEAVVYLSSQAGMKRHPNTVRSQLRILKSVPNSYLLIKGISEPRVIQDFFNEISLEEKVNPNRIIFLDRDIDEKTHRANLQIADVALDTYPYNGATTTLETLWMGIPLVTRVGDQFSSRNSYSFLMNLGIHEGISWSDEEYIEWGIKFGTEIELRKSVMSKLIDSRRTSILWNAKKYTLHLENSFQEMWMQYLEKSSL